MQILRTTRFGLWITILAGLVTYGGIPACGKEQTTKEQPRRASTDAVAVSTAKPDTDGFFVHEVSSPYQAGKTSIRVILPDERKAGWRYSVIYVLPVESGTETRFGDGLMEVKKQGLHNKHSVIFVAPAFTHLPWYADHPDKAEIRQETFLLKVVVPFIESIYPAWADADHRLLLGFSKSGWGAWSLLLRHPDVFGKAAAWDAPMMMDKAGKWDSSDVFGTQENFAEYRIETLLRVKTKELSRGNRLILTGYEAFREDHVRVHDLMSELKIPHVFKDGPKRQHDWHSGWVSEAVELLMQNEKRE